MLLICSLVALKWTCEGENCGAERAEVVVPLRYDQESRMNLTIPVVVTNRNASKTPIVFLGPGNGAGNLPLRFDFVRDSFTENPLIFVGYRGVESKPQLPDAHVSILAKASSSDITQKKLAKIVEKIEKEYHLNDFWIPQRARDVEFVLTEMGIEYAHLIGIGEDGSRIAHYLAALKPKMIVRMVLFNPSVPVPHNDLPIRLLAVYRMLCKKDPECPYKQIKWIPADSPNRVYGIFNVHQEKLEFSAMRQLRSPETAPAALDFLQSMTDGSGVGFLALSGFSGPETMNLNWADVAMHVCARPRDNSMSVLPAFELLCDKIHPIVDDYPGAIDAPILIISGELEIPRANTALSYFKNMSSIPTLVDQIILNATASRYELLRPDVLKGTLSYLNDGVLDFDLIPPPKIQWTTRFPMTKILKFSLLAGVAISVLGTVFMYWQSLKAEKKHPH